MINYRLVKVADIIYNGHSKFKQKFTFWIVVVAFDEYGTHKIIINKFMYLTRTLILSSVKSVSKRGSLRPPII